MGQELSPTERAIAEHLSAGELQQVAVLTLRAYGPEILGFLLSQLRSEQHAEEVFSCFAEDLWRSLPRLALRSSMRAYAYALARNARHRFLERDLRKQRDAVPLSSVVPWGALVAEVRTQTAPFLVTASKTKLAELRERLTPDEQALLTLRVDRGLEWREIAEVFGETGDLTRAAAQKRKRFQLIKEKLTRWAREEGLLDGPSD